MVLAGDAGRLPADAAKAHAAWLDAGGGCERIPPSPTEGWSLVVDRLFRHRPAATARRSSGPPGSGISTASMRPAWRWTFRVASRPIPGACSAVPSTPRTPSPSSHSNPGCSPSTVRTTAAGSTSPDRHRRRGELAGERACNHPGDLFSSCLAWRRRNSHKGSTATWW